MIVFFHQVVHIPKIISQRRISEEDLHNRLNDKPAIGNPYGNHVHVPVIQQQERIQHQTVEQIISLRLCR